MSPDTVPQPTFFGVFGFAFAVDILGLARLSSRR